MRPQILTPELQQEICDRLIDVGSLRRVCASSDMPLERTVRKWCVEHPDFEAAYARAKQIGIDALVDETLDISDDGTNDWMNTKHGPQVNGEALGRSKIRVETRRWLAERMAPKKYGLRTGVDLTSSDGSMAPVDETARTARLAAILAEAEKRKSIDDIV